MTKTKPKLILGLDLGFRATGVILARPIAGEPGYELLENHCFVTEKASKKANLYVSADDIRCCQQMVRELEFYVSNCGGEIAAIVAEIPSGGGKGARAHRGMGMATAMLATYVVLKKLPLIQIRPEEIKKEVGGVGNASKKDIQEKVMALWPDHPWPAAACRLEHVADAAGALVVARASDMYKLLLNL